MSVLDPFDAVAAAVADGGHDLAIACEGWPKPILPVPADAPPCGWRHPKLGLPMAMWDYLDAGGALLGHDARFESGSGDKVVLTLTWCEFQDGCYRWHPKAFPKLRTVYGLDRLTARPSAPVIIAEGCKAAEAAAALLDDHVAVTWPGGCNADHLANWGVLEGRSVTVWPDNDVPGIEVAARIAQRLAGLGAAVSVIDLAGLDEAKGWDAADALAAEWLPERAAQFVSERAIAFASATAPKSDGWGVPDMAILSLNRRPPPPFPPDLFGPLWPLIVELAEGSGGPVDYIGAGLLSVAASIIGGKRRVVPFTTSTWADPPVLWVGCVGEPSSGKSPALSALTSHLGPIETEFGRDHAARMQLWEATRERAKVERENWEKAVKAAVKDGRATPPKPVAANEPQQPPRPRFMVMDTTPEALWDVLEGNPQGLLNFQDEIAGWLANFERYSGDSRAFWLQAWNGGRFVVDRKSRMGQPLSIPFAGVSVLGGIQPDKLASAMLGGDDDGMAARFLYVWPDAVPYRRPKQAADTARLERLYRRLAGLVWALDGEGNPTAIKLPLDDDAADLFEAWKRDMGAAADDGGTLYKGWAGKAGSLVLRTALVLELLAWADGSDVVEPKVVSAATLAKVWAFVEGYARPMAMRVFGDAALSPVDRNAATLARYIVKQRLAIVNVRAIHRGPPKLPGLKDSKAVAEAVAALVDADWLRDAGARAGDTAGRRSGDYVVNPAVLPPQDTPAA